MTTMLFRQDVVLGADSIQVCPHYQFRLHKQNMVKQGENCEYEYRRRFKCTNDPGILLISPIRTLFIKICKTGDNILNTDSK
jgi:hypothetical protein